MRWLCGLAWPTSRWPNVPNMSTDTKCTYRVLSKQDTNLPQAALVERLRACGASLFVVGDSNQAIYMWRGAIPGAMDKQVMADSGRPASGNSGAAAQAGTAAAAESLGPPSPAMAQRTGGPAEAEVANFALQTNYR